MEFYFGSFLVGVVSSLIVWWLTNIILSPKLIMSDKIARTIKGHHQIAIMNGSRYRDVCDIYVYARYHFASGNYYSAKIEHILLLDKNRGSKCKKKDMASSVVIFINGYKDPNGKFCSIDEFFKSQENRENGYIDIFVLGRDGLFCGIGKLSKARYYAEQVVPDSCIKRGTVDVVEISEDFGAQSMFYDNHRQTDI